MVGNIPAKKITVYSCDGTVVKEYMGALDLFKEDANCDSGNCVHFKNEDGKHVRIYNATVIIEEI